jgi:hypothetical protein
VSTCGDSQPLQLRPPSSEHSYVAVGSFSSPVEKKNLAVALAVVAGGPDSIVVSGTTSVVPVARANGERESVAPQTSPASGSPEVVMSTQALLPSSQCRRRTGSASEPGTYVKQTVMEPLYAAVVSTS